MNPKSLGLAGGLLYGLMAFVLTLFAMITGISTPIVVMLIDMVPMYSISIMGAIIGFAFSFIKGFILLFLLAKFYMFFEGK
jgi:hypothetical protein